MSEKAKFLFVGNGSYLNRGCEAIVRGTVKVLQQCFGDCQFINANFDVTNPPLVPDENDSAVMHKPIPPFKRWSPKWLIGQVLKRTNQNLSNSFYFGCLKWDITNSDAVLSLGGDNYTLDYGIPRDFISLDQYVLKQKKPLIIWGASIGPFDSNPKFAKTIYRHLKEDVTAIFVREQTSLNNLNKYGVSDNVYLMPDPAFLMNPEPVNRELLGYDIAKGTIGFNFSPLMARHIKGRSRKQLILIAAESIKELHKKTGRHILLIPHVTSPHSDDYKLLKDIKGRVETEVGEKLHIVPNNLNAAQTKWVISRLSCLIAARTHATIAAFSTGVPTISLSYSIKALGINETLFGHTDYVISPKNLSAETITATTEFVLSEEKEIINKLRKNADRIHNSVWAAGLKLKEIIEG